MPAKKKIVRGAEIVTMDRGLGDLPRGDILIACDGLHSPVRRQLFPAEGPFAYRGINMWRGTTRWPPYLTGASIARIGARHTTMILYPIRPADADEIGRAHV